MTARRLFATLLIGVSLGAWGCASGGITPVPPAPTAADSLAEKEAKAVRLIVFTRDTKESIVQKFGELEEDGVLTPAQTKPIAEAADQVNVFLIPAVAAMKVYLTLGSGNIDELREAAAPLEDLVRRLILAAIEKGIRP